MTATAAGRQTIGLVLMKSEEAQATVEYVTDSCPEIRVQDHSTYFLLETLLAICGTVDPTSI